MHRVIKFSQKAWLKWYINMNIDLKKKARKGIFFKEKSQLKNNAIFGKTMGNVRKVRNIKLATTEVGKNCLVSEPNYHTTKFFLEIYYP